MITRSIEVPRTARYALSAEPTGSERELWFLLHGYGELAAGFLEACSRVASPERLLVAPEGLSRFYHRGGRGPIGASWMTSEARADEIADYVRYLDLLDAELGAAFPGPPPAPCVLGFSQGVATAFRWAALGARAPRRLLAFGSLPPPDLDLGTARERLAAARPVLAAGSEDGFLDDARLRAEERRFAQAGVPLSVVRFAGGHAVDPATLAALVDGSAAGGGPAASGA